LLAKTLLNARSGATNVFVVRGADIEEAIEVTAMITLGLQCLDSQDTYRLSKKELAKNFWLVAYFGAGTVPCPFQIDEVKKSNGKLSLTYSVPKQLFSTMMSNPHFVWIELGDLTPGRYSLELRQTDGHESSVTRSFKVSK
jgi:2-keto-3-deoxy-6-phosphogluconate aldolase